LSTLSESQTEPEKATAEVNSLDTSTLFSNRRICLAVDMTAQRPATYSDVFIALRHLDAPYVVVSGMAVVLHGHTRPVFDLDIVISNKADEQNRAMQALTMAGFVSTIMIPPQLATVFRMFDQVEREVDVFCKYHIPFQELWDDAVEIAVGDTVARIASFDNLLKAKRMVGRPHDLEDVAGLLRLRD
jgi:hypothetical protein